MRFLEAGRGNFWLFEAWGRKIPRAAFSGSKAVVNQPGIEGWGRASAVV